MRWLRGKEKGFTLVEVLIAIPITALVVLAATAAIIHLLRANDINHGVVAMRLVQNAGDRVSVDGVQAQQVVFGDSMTDSDGFLNFRWTGAWVEDDTYQGRTNEVTYTLVPSGSLYKLERHDVAWDYNGVQMWDVTTTIGQYYDASLMSCDWTDSENTTFAFTVASRVGTKLESRTYNVAPRSTG